MSVNLLAAELVAGSTREGYAHHELELGPSLGATGWGGTVYPDSGKLLIDAPAHGRRNLLRDAPELDYWDAE